MCLDTITQRFAQNKTVRFAYKGFDIGSMSDLRFPCNPHNGVYFVERGIWLTAQSPTVKTEKPDDAGETHGYKAGFHCYTSNKPPNYFGQKLVRVKIRGLICTGKQEDSNVIVAKEMLVPRQKKRKRA